MHCTHTLDGVMEDDYGRPEGDQDTAEYLDQQLEELHRLTASLDELSRSTHEHSPPSPVISAAPPTTTKQLLNVPQRESLRRRTDRGSNASILSNDSGLGPSRETSSSQLLDAGTERKKESLVQLVADSTARQGLGALAEGETKEEECDRLTRDLDDSMERLHEHIRELDNMNRAPSEQQHSNRHLRLIEKTCKQVKSQVMELRQELKSRKVPPHLSIPLFPPYLTTHTLPSPELPPQEQKLRDAVKANLPRFVRYTNLGPFMVAHLIAKRVITEDAASHLVLADHTPSQKNLLFYISVVPSAGDNAYSRLHLCLRATEDHSGHEELAKLLDDVLR